MKQIILIFLAFTSLSLVAQNDLNYYIAAAKQNSPLINDSRNQSKANQIEAERLKAFYTKPQVGIVAKYMFSPIITQDNNVNAVQLNADEFGSYRNYYGYDLAYSNGGTYQAMLNVVQPIFNAKFSKVTDELYNANANISENNAKLGEHDIEKIVADQYILCLQDNKQTFYAEGMVKLLADQKKILTKLVESSIYKQSDLTLLSIEHQNFLAQLATFKANYRRDLMDLNILCGINDTTFRQLQNVALSLNNPISNSMFLEKYRLDSVNLTVQQKIFELKYKPQLNLFANTGLNAVYAPTIPKRFGLSLGLNFTYNFYDGNQKKINRKKTEVLAQSVSFYRNNFITQNTIRKAKIITELQSYTDRISIAQQQLKDYDILLGSYKKEIILGQLSIINYTMILKNMAIVQRDYTLLFSQQQTLINAYNYWNW